MREAWEPRHKNEGGMGRPRHNIWLPLKKYEELRRMKTIYLKLQGDDSAIFSVEIVMKNLAFHCKILFWQNIGE